MKVEVNLYATLKKYMNKETFGQSSTIDADDGLCVEDMIQQLKIPSDLVKLIFINGVHGKRDTILKDGDRLGLFPPVGGG
ncbi:MAG: MoaD/ThiS family protein [Desulfobacterales bacterium]|nr:MoaD/ThiS family protein [Deltaproteobacteria bacterium]NNL43070.1 MoaD/ThiS family protein [Desulfobacterales bacterium]